MIHTMEVPYPAWCKWCETTTERSTMISGDPGIGRSRIGVTLNHDSCGRIMAELSLTDLREMGSIQRAEVARELVNRANAQRPKAPVTDKTPFELWLKVSGGGPWMLIGHASSFKEADALIETLDKRWTAWEEAGHPPLHEGDPLNGYEGCDIEARGLNGRVWDLDPDNGWEPRP